MGRETTTTITCDKDGCGKEPGNTANSHVVVNVAMTPPEGSDELPMPIRSFDFCSFEHAAEAIGSLAWPID